MKKLVIVLLAIVAIAASPVKDGLDIGDTATDFKLKNVDGKTVSLADFKEAKGYIIIFDCNTCPYSKAYNQRIMDLNAKYAGKGIPVLAINSNDPNASSGDSFEEMVRIAKKKDYKFPYLVDETQEIAKAYGATNTPHVFVLSKDLKVTYIGAIDDNSRKADAVTKRYVEDAADALLQGKPAPNPKTKAIGCGIKWKSA
jgi:peroxiredoxin